MYDFLAGRLVAKTPTEVVVDVHGVGWRADVSLRTSERLPRTGADIRLLVHLKTSEDRMRLFGFVDGAERELFVHLQSVAGIGPSHGLALLSAAEPEEVWRRIRDEDSKTLARTKGIGPKIAQRICVELKDRARRHVGTAAATPATGPTSAIVDDAISALLVLGYTETQARKAAEKAAAAQPTNTPLETLVREALRNT
ncbi:MAG: Holliday junction branch migration protein RuvA [Deltaproteobacteria bacterium]|nr:Holliday junction branch migration protein RuvA [Deltaproteobacteria bacterium]